VLQQMQRGLAQAEQTVGMSGTTVMGLYDDPTHQACAI